MGRANLPVPDSRKSILTTDALLPEARMDKFGGFAVNHQTVGFYVWLGLAIVALIWASLRLLRARRQFKKVPQTAHVRSHRSVLSPIADETVADKTR